jgi:chemotaxis protein CheC
VRQTAPTELELDALREVANIGCGHAATALSRLVGGRTVRIDVPRVVVTGPHDTREVAEDDGLPAVCVFLGLEGDIRGRMVLLWSEHDAQALVGLLLRQAAPPGGSLLEEPGRSALEEAGNIVASSCLSAVATLTRLRVLPSTPSLARMSVSDAVRSLWDGEAAVQAVVLEARFHAAHVPPLMGRLFLVPDRAGLPRLFGALGMSTHG